MPKLIKWRAGVAAWAEDPFTAVEDDDQSLPRGELIISLARFRREGRDLLAAGRGLGVRLESDDDPAALVLDLPELEVIALSFPKYRDGRAYSAARILRERLGFRGELRAVGDVLLEMAHLLVRCGFDAVEPADGTTPEQWTRVAHRYRHVYQRAADGRAPAFAERAAQSVRV